MAAERLVLDLCRAVARLMDGRRLQHVAHADVCAGLPQATTAQIDAAIAVAAQRGWMTTSGGPQPHSVTLTAEGWRESGV